MKYFNISIETCSIGFQEHVTILPNGIVVDQFRRRLYHRAGSDKGDPAKLKLIIQHNSSLRVDFGWSFESSTHYETIMDECVKEIFPFYNIDERRPFGHLVSDLRCSWLGFVPFDIFDIASFESMTADELISFNEELINFQTDVINFITSHRIYKQHSLLRNQIYKFEYFKEARKDPDALSDAYAYYMDAIKDACMLTSISRDILEMEIGCHFLHYPELFSELLSISILQGNVYE